MISLLDVNVLIALLDQNHPFHIPATKYFQQSMRDGWATCPLTENALLRIMSHPTYPGGPYAVGELRKQFCRYLTAPGHRFWPDDLSFADESAFPWLPVSGRLTDFYLLALAVKRAGRFATFDRALDAAQLPGGEAAYHVISSV